MSLETQDIFLHLVRLGIGHTEKTIASQVSAVDWQAVLNLANRQGLLAVLTDGIEQLKKISDQSKVDCPLPPKPIMLQLIGQVLQNYEQRYKLYCRAIADLAGFYNSHEFKMMVLKGYACSLDWPKPEHRPCGDIDIWQFGQQKEADATLTKEKGTNIDNSHHHHTVFNWKGFMVENHYDFVNVHQNKSNTQIEKVLKELGQDDSYVIDLIGEKVYLPSPNLFSLFLLKHTALHFVMGEFSLRQLLDWAFFVQKHGKEVDWHWMMNVLEEYGMMPAFTIFNAICVEDLGFDAQIFPRTDFDPSVKNRVLTELFYPKYDSDDPIGFIPKIIYKYRRWKGSRWKYKLCSNESQWSSFWSGVWAHLLKPGSI